MPKLTKKDSQSFVRRFNGFNDALIKSIRISHSKSAGRNVRFVILTRDEEAKEYDGWNIVELNLNELDPFCFHDEAYTTSYDVFKQWTVCLLV